MNRDTFEGACRQLAGKARSGWCGLTGDAPGRAAAERDQRAGGMQLRCGLSKERLDRQLGEFRFRNRNWDHIDPSVGR